MKKTEVFSKQSGHLGQYEEWWYLIEHEDGTQEIEKKWHDTKVNGLKTNSGSKVYSLEDGLREAPARAVDEVKSKLGL
ncbi:hypothetical protein ACJKIH_14700 [Brucella pseudogrignonensis]|uniref:hypothetical protein n=1 Tax=Brucella pseudogrignonensis TaxID=419475 RepID=UPI0038B68A5D